MMGHLKVKKINRQHLCKHNKKIRGTFHRAVLFIRAKTLLWSN